MKLYLYSCQDLIIDCKSLYNIKAGAFYYIEVDENEVFKVYPTTSEGVMAINGNILTNTSHNQILFHKISNDATLCEIKPFVLNENAKQYSLKGGSIRLVENKNITYIYFNGMYYGSIKQNNFNIKFDKFEKHGQEYGVIYLFGDKQYIIVFNNNQIIFDGQYVDNEVLNDYIQIYIHIPNIFNVGGLIKYDFKNKKIEHKAICDRGDERKQISMEFNIIYFFEALKCGRYKYAYNKLSYELKSEIDINILGEYFTPFDKYEYLYEQDVYITLKNNKIVGIYHITVMNGLINNIY